jgi:HD-like signal output (HDOD) protein
LFKLFVERSLAGHFGILKPGSSEKDNYFKPIKVVYMNEITKEISEKAIQKALQGIKIPTPPQIIVDLQIEMASSDVNINEIESIIAKDVGISGKLIKVVNSPFFGLRSNITSIQHALNLLGIKNISNIVNSISLTESISKNQLIDMTHFWDNATDIAMVATSISRLIGVATPNEAYTLGLFHNAGIAILIEKFSHYPEILKLAYAEKKRRITDIENDNFHCNHAVVGYYVARSWKLPMYISEAIADHHKTHPIFSDEVKCDLRKKNLLAILKLAENICKTYQTLGHETRDFEFDKLKEDLFFYLGISEYEFEELKEEVLSLGLIN